MSSFWKCPSNLSFHSADQVGASRQNLSGTDSRDIFVGVDLRHALYLNASVWRNWSNAAAALSIVFSGPVNLMKYGPFGVSTTVARMRKPGLLWCSAAPGRISAT